MEDILINIDSNNNLKSTLKELAKQANRIELATAFFSETQLLLDWEKQNKKIHLLVSLRPPTNYYSLKSVLSKVNIDISFLGPDFHSKFFIFYNNNKPISAVLGSSNFTNGGLINNVETNLLVTDQNVLNKLSIHFNDLLECSNYLQPTDLSNYKEIFDNFAKRQAQNDKETNLFSSKTLQKRSKRKREIKVCKTAKQYFNYWKIVNEIRSIIEPVAKREYRDVPIYLALDHFWHWVKVVWGSDRQRGLTTGTQSQMLPKLFEKYSKWDKYGEGNNYTHHMYKQSKTVFNKLLSQKNVEKLTKEQARQVFSNLHSSRMPIQRFGADDLFIENNSIEKIRQSLKYLIYSNDDLDLRIHNLMKNPKYKLNYLGDSGIQEINGWVRPTIYPIRNDKADYAIEFLGYKL